MLQEGIGTARLSAVNVDFALGVSNAISVGTLQAGPDFHRTFGPLHFNMNGPTPGKGVVSVIAGCRQLLCDFVVGRASQAPSGRQKRNCLQKVRFARAIFAGQHNVALVCLQLEAGVISKMVELELLDPDGSGFAVSVHGSLVAQSARQTRIGIST